MEKLADFLKTIFGSPDTGMQWGAVGGTAVTSFFGGLIGFAFGGGLPGMLLGLLLGGLGGALFGDKFNKLGASLGLDLKKPPLRKLVGWLPPNKDVTQRRDMMIGDRKHYIDVPNLDRFKTVAFKTKELLSEQRRKLEVMATGLERQGADEQIDQDTTKAIQMLANGQEWDKIAQEWAKPGGERDQLVASLKKAKAAAGLPFDENQIPKPPLTNARLPELGELGDDLRQYAVRMFQASGEGKTEEEWKKKYDHPAKQLRFVREALTKEMEEMGPKNWDKNLKKSFMRSFSDTVNWEWRWGWPINIGKPDIYRVNAPGDAMATVGQILGKKTYPGFNEYAEAMHYAEEGERLAKGNQDTNAEQELGKVKKYLQAGMRKELVEQQYDHLYRTVQRIENVAENEFPRFIAQADALEREVNALNQQTTQTKSKSDDVLVDASEKGLGEFASPATPAQSKSPAQQQGNNKPTPSSTGVGA